MSCKILLCFILAVVVVVTAHPQYANKIARMRRDSDLDENMLRELEELLMKELDNLEESQTAREEIHQDQQEPARRLYDTGPPEGWQASMTSSQALRAFSKASKRTQKAIARMLEREEQFTRSLENITGDAELVRRVMEVSLFTRADYHPLCSNPVSCTDSIYRTADGSCNNLANPSWGMAGVQHSRWSPPIYRNQQWRFVTQGDITRNTLPSPRAVSNRVHKASSTVTLNSQGVSLAMFEFLQFLDHDLILTPEGGRQDKDCCAKRPIKVRGFCMPLTVPDTDEHFDHTYCMDARRSFTVANNCTVTPVGDALQNQINDLTAFIDASNVYGSTQEEQDFLRTKVSGLLRTSNKDFLPPDVSGDHIPCAEDGEVNGNFCFKAGDIRANVVATLASVHTYFVREHNRIARALLEMNPTWTDEQIFQTARKIVIAEMQNIIYSEVLPIIMDAGELAKYGVSADYEYDPTIDASISSAFAIAFRFGHALVPHEYPATSANEPLEDRLLKFKQLKASSILFRDNYKMFDEFTKAIVNTKCRRPDNTLDSAVRDFLFFDGLKSFDLGALNIGRSRDWGTPFFSTYIQLCLGTTIGDEWSDLVGLTHSQEMVDLLKQVYASPLDIDLFPAIVTETKVGDSFLGKIGSCLIGWQFQKLKFGDRFFFQTSNTTIGFTAAQRASLEKVTFAGVICKNTNLEEIPRNVFKANVNVGRCTRYNNERNFLDLTLWAEA